MLTTNYSDSTTWFGKFETWTRTCVEIWLLGLRLESSEFEHFSTLLETRTFIMTRFQVVYFYSPSRRSPRDSYANVFRPVRRPTRFLYTFYLSRLHFSNFAKSRKRYLLDLCHQETTANHQQTVSGLCIAVLITKHIYCLWFFTNVLRI